MKFAMPEFCNVAALEKRLAMGDLPEFVDAVCTDPTMKFRLFDAIDFRFSVGEFEYLGIREGHIPTGGYFPKGTVCTKYDSYPPGPSLYALWRMDEEKGAA